MPTDATLVHDTATTHAIIERHDRFMSVNYARYPIAMVRGKGSTLTDADGNDYLDLFAGFGAGLLGHCHEALIAALSDQAQKLWHAGNLFHTEPQTRLAQAIARHGFGGKSFFCHSGADANEAAIKLARLYGKANAQGATDAKLRRYKVITANRSFHGRTFGTMPATGQPKVREGFEPLPPGYANIPYNDLDAARKAIDADTVAIMVEPIQGEGGINVPDDGYLPGLRELCNERDLLLICDEVWTGGGRTGKYFAHQHWDIEPDIMTLAKGVGGGLPVGVACAQPRVAEYFDHHMHGRAVHATTLGGNCLGAAVAATIFAVIERDGLLNHAEDLGRRAMDRLRAFAKDHPAVKAVRGKGLFIGVELDPSAKGAWFDGATAVVDRCRERGVLLNATQGTVVRIAPAMIVTESEMDHGLSVLEQVIAG